MYKCLDTKEVAFTYKDYLKTEHWKNIKMKMKNSKYKYMCYSCKSKTKLQLHHKSYKRVGNEKLTDLIWLCEDCHKKTHEINKNGSSLWKSARICRKRINK